MLRRAFITGLVLLAVTPGWCIAAKASEAGKSPAVVGGATAHELLAVESGIGDSSSARRARASADAWLRLLADYTRPESDAGGPKHGDGDWFPRPVPLTLPIGRGGASLPVLLLPVPVPAAAPASAQCSTNAASSHPYSVNYIAEKSPPPAPPTSPPVSVTRPPASSAGRGASPLWKTDYPRRKEFIIEVPAPPQLDYIVSSQQLVELFQEQVAADAELPPLLIPDYTAGQDGASTGAAEGLLEDEHVRRARQVRIRRYQVGVQQGGAPRVATGSGVPPTPRLERSLLMRGELTVPRSGYTEPYTVWWDAASGAARTDLHGGSSSAYRSILADGRVQHVEVRTDRSGDGEVRRCVVEVAREPTPADLAAPAFPDMSEFTFAGYSQAEFGRVERWTRVVEGAPGELGGARGEALTFRHEVLVARAPDNYTTTPLRYSVTVDSSVLGTACDGYVHRYTELRDQRHDPAVLRLDPAETCEVTETEVRRGAADPLREYTLPDRDTRYDTDFQRFKSEFKRRYVDDTEEAVRKTLMVQNSRFVESGNRQGATSAMKVNYLGDRLDAELALLGGVEAGAEALPAEHFPHSRDQLAAMRPALPRAFDWRQRGAVTHVRNQGSCNSCWAFAVTGAVEGALFVRTRRLLPLSEQALVDCAQPFGGHGCGNTWPSAAYDYVRERGLPSLHQYTPYQGKEATCLDERVPPVTHISSHVNVTRDSITALKVAIRRHGPTVVIIAIPKSLILHSKGVYYDDRCAKRKSEHAVLAVGWGEHRGETYFIVKNSWSTAWAEGGYMRISGAGNTCGVMSRPSYPRLERTDVDAAAASAPAETAQD